MKGQALVKNFISHFLGPPCNVESSRERNASFHKCCNEGGEETRSGADHMKALFLAGWNGTCQGPSGNQ